MSTMAEDNARDTNALRKWRSLLVGLNVILNDDGIMLRDAERLTLESAAENAEKRAEHIEAVWN